MKRMLGTLVCALLLAVTPLHGQDIESQLSGNGANQGFTVKNNNGTTLLTVRGDGKVGIGTASPGAVLSVSGKDGFVVSGSPGLGAIPATGSGARMMFYPNKMAFRAGYVATTQWDDGNIGLASVALGENTTASGQFTTALGLETIASGSFSTAAGYFSTASGFKATAIGINALASGVNAMALGNATEATGDYSTAMGNYVNTGSKVGSFMIGDKSTTTTLSAGSVNRFYGRFANGYCLYTNSACSIAAILYGNANSWSTLSDVRKKERFLPADGEAMLERFQTLRLGTWNYRGQSAEDYRHYGPMAQEWFAAFGHDGIGTVGNDTTLSSADVDGVLCIAVQALEKRTTELREKTAEVAELREQLSALRQESAAQVDALRDQLLVLQEHMQTMQREVAALREKKQSDTTHFVHIDGVTSAK